MVRIEGSLLVAAPVRKVWEVATDPSLTTYWNSNVTEVSDVSEAPLRVGSSWLQTVNILGRPNRLTTQIVEWQPPNYGVVAMSGMGSPRVTTTVEAVEGGSNLTQVMEISLPTGLGGIAFRFAGPTIQAELNEALRRQKMYIENGGRGNH